MNTEQQIEFDKVKGIWSELAVTAYAKEMISAAKSYSEQAIKAADKYKADVEAELKERSDKINEIKKKLADQIKKTETEQAESSKKVKEEYPDIHVISGLSNISYGIRSRKSLNLSFLIGAMMNGMDAAILDPLSRDMQGGIYATEALIGKDAYCRKYLKAYRKDLFGVQKK